MPWECQESMSASTAVQVLFHCFVKFGAKVACTMQEMIVLFS